jgi:MFS family permease
VKNINQFRSNEEDQRLRRWITILVAGNGISNIGDFVYLVALNLYVLDTTHSAYAVAAVWIVPLVAQSIIGGWIGSLTDRLPARGTLIVLELSRAIFVFALPLVSISWIYPLLFLLGSASTCFRRVFLPYRTWLVPSEKRKFVNSVISLFQSGSLLPGPAIAGVFMQLGLVSYAFWADSVSFAVSGVSFILLPAYLKAENQHGANQGSSKRIRTWHTIRADWSQAWRFLSSNWLFTALFIASAIGHVFGQAADSQEVVYAETALHLGRFGYGMMVVAAGIGFLTGSVILTAFAKYFSTSWLIASGGIMVGAGYLVYALAHGFWQAVVGLVILGIFGSAGGVGLNTYTQHAMPVESMGRVNNLLDPPQQLATLLMMILASVITDHFGVRVLMIGMTCVMVGTGIFNTVIALQRSHRATIESEVQAM